MNEQDAVSRVKAAISENWDIPGHALEFAATAAITAYNAILRERSQDAERDLDALLDSVHPDCGIDAVGPTGVSDTPVGCWIKWPGDTDDFGQTEWEYAHGMADKRMAAIRAAVAQAQGRGEGEKTP